MKRLFDITFSLFGLIFFSPLLLMVDSLIKKENGGPVYYRGVSYGNNQIISQSFIPFRNLDRTISVRSCSSVVHADSINRKIGN
jgi:lipopolysaccharide/colanic/teichoic acid biosynthesis glycosyltransferase